MNGTIHHLFILSLLSFFVFNTSANCDYNTNCTCDGGRPQGQYCDVDFYGLDSDCIYDYIYECNPQGEPCDYGSRQSCTDCGCLKCPC
ncbi:hypothetical protein RhiirC2_793955 [Rhizophagus irregularis]|uniref:Uncharacterized protein n=1 Tax=Rhizophagus irregularis TaxID=588596 RepID=A0A2N1MEH3_9GLOM|nr:hypothetical protein RhiirC2_793955 [Rhizophagus irregularis]